MLKKLLSALVVLLVLFNGPSVAQTTHPVELGFNVGASWLKSDIKMKKLGGAGGFTFGQMYLQNEKSALDWGWRFRYLNAVAYGQDSKKFSGIANNPIYNGAYDSTLNYNSKGGFLYQNYKTSINELSLELVIGANRMRNKTKVYPYVFGGLGITKAVTKTDQLDAFGKRYNYFSVDSNGTANSSQITSSLNTMLDGSYETDAEGSESPRWKFMPSFGVGLGYQFTPVFSMGLEHKMTWALHDGLDGNQWNNDNSLSSNNDKYHYSSVWLKFSFGRGTHHSTTTNTNTNTTTNIVAPSGDKPSIRVTNPSVSPFTSSSQSYTVKATIKNVTSKSDIKLQYNGVDNANFTYDAGSLQFAFPLMLLNGNNTFTITATNINGSTTDNSTVIYQTQIVVPPPAPAPLVTITNPTVNPFSTTMNNVTVLATVLNVTSSSQIGVTINGVASSSFIFNPSSHGLNINSNLNPGANTFVISASNPSGADSKSVTVIYSIAPVQPPPAINFINPAINPFTSAVAILPINAMVQHVTSVAQLSVTTNLGIIPSGALSFNPSTGQLNFNATLVPGANTVNISATNGAGSDSRSITIIYNQPVAAIPAPVVTIATPTSNPYNTVNNVEIVNGIVLNVASSSQITVMLNGVSTPAFSYNLGTKQLSFTALLIPGANVISILANNGSGSDSKSQTIIYTAPAAAPAPVVNITVPNVNPFNTTSPFTAVTATVLNVIAASQIAVSFNGVPTSSFSYNLASKQLTFSPALIAGANILTITATTSSGTDSKSQTIIYTQPAAALAPVVTISSPSVSPFNTSTTPQLVNGNVINVTSSSQITVSLNGLSLPFTYNMATKQFSINPVLIPGANVVTVIATTPSGSDSKSVTLIYTAPVIVAPAPIVTITSPAVNPFNTSTSTCGITATVVNVTASSQITASIGGATVPFLYNMATKQLTMTASLTTGGNIVTISANTSSGTDSKSTTIIYTPPVALPAPVVTFTNPAGAVGATTTPTFNIEAMVTNITSISNVVAKVNGVVVSTATYNAATKTVKLTAAMNIGTNTVTITATNTSGTDTKSVQIKRRDSIEPIAPDTTAGPANPGTPNPHPIPGGGTGTGTGTPPKGRAPAIGTVAQPTIAFGLPNPLTVMSPIQAITGVVNGVSVQSDIVVKLNGNPAPFTYTASTKTISLTVPLNMGPNTVSVTATNAAGVKTESLVITRH